jgi:hydroxyacylglutathione hydrolase
VVGDEGQAVVVDPRRDCRVYLDVAYRHGAVVTHIFETHTHEDFLSGAPELAALTGAAIFRGGRGAGPVGYGAALPDGAVFCVGNLQIRALATPGHTYDSVSLVLADCNVSDDPVAVFTGDALFVGGVGRTDFYPGQDEEVAGLMYDSLFGRLLPLGDHVIVLPCHGGGSACGAHIADRDFTTIGYERRHNPLLRVGGRDEFVRRKVAERPYKPPYFREMGRLNALGPPALATLPRPAPLSPDDLADALGHGLIVVDTRSPEAFAGAFIPGAIALPLDLLPGFAGWFLPYDRPLGLVVEQYEDVEKAVRFLARLGYDDVRGFLRGGMRAWETSGRRYDSIPTLFAADLERRLQTGPDFTLLDVRTRDEFEGGHLPEARNVFVGELPERLAEIPRDRPVVTFCGSGRRAILAASYLRLGGFEDVWDCLGSMAACAAIGCQIVAGS